MEKRLVHPMRLGLAQTARDLDAGLPETFDTAPVNFGKWIFHGDDDPGDSPTN